MKKMNNKGFAITTVVYGLSIMGIMLISIIMGVISANREHNRSLAKSISEELNRYSKTETSFSSAISGGQEYIVPEGQAGWYRIELWGAQGGGSKGGLGAYTTGIIELNENDKLYFYVGKHKNTGFGGEETDVRVVNGDYNDYSSYSTRIMVAAGGGADEGADGGTLVGYTSFIKGYGGRYDNEFNLTPRVDLVYPSLTNGTLYGYPREMKENVHYAQTNSSPNKFLDATSRSVWYSQYTTPSAEDNGGDGYISSKTVTASGGFVKKYGGSMYGGTSFISGYAGGWAYEDGIMVEGPSYLHKQTIYNETTGEFESDPNNTRLYYFLDGMMYPGVNEGEGKAKITKLLDKNEERQTLPRHNSKFDKIQYVVSCVDSDYATSYIPDVRMSVEGEDPAYDRYHHGYYIAFNENFTDTANHLSCVKVTYTDEISGLDELAIFQTDYNYAEDYRRKRITVGRADDPQCAGNQLRQCSTVIKEIADYEPSIDESTSFVGTRFSAYQFDSTQPLPDQGNYIIQPVLYENRVVTAAATADKDNEAIKAEYMGGYQNQQWSVEKVTVPTSSDAYDYCRSYNCQNVYKIVELSRFKALSVKNDENKLGNTLVANRAYNQTSIDETQLWHIVPMGNGTYTIETIISPFDDGKDTGYLVAQTDNEKDNYTAIIIGKKTTLNGKLNPVVQRFKFISTDYSSN